ncbi:GNAT family N-acetyltransferase [Candidatus Uabimicrobium amorphum]|uniref:N-acetyltransferase n=1 Tax=Uabimicrobium amorphum TaxID=2596890 RepID=A0A5S9ITX1_UABAM|nr:GNAT family N-acetyltransferase [Candidatus Uabimicrobium amorphum]BBM88019.1 N-acetyltransferase [Candidatus Uabimicrobium amorphum]
MIVYLDINDLKTRCAVHALQRKCYTQEAQLINFYDIPPLQETREDLHHSEETFVGYVQQQQIQGVISYKIDNEVLDVHRLMVDPNHSRKGIAKSLVSFILQKKKDVIVATPQKNIPAVNLYLQMGFTTTHHQVVAEGLQMQYFRFKTLDI